MMIPVTTMTSPITSEMDVHHRHNPTTTSNCLILHTKPSFSRRFLQWIHHAYQSLKELIYITIRGSQISFYFSPVAILLPMEFIAAHVGHILSLSGGDDSYRYTWSYIRWSITQLGPAFCKLAQWMATRRDLFPRRMADELSILQDRGLPHARRHTIEACEKEFGSAIWNDLQLSDEMIGCGSAAQVYKGNYKGTNVAVKVLHPDLYTRMEADLLLAQAFANIVHHVAPMLNLPKSVANFGTILLSQADLSAEASHLRTFHENFGKVSFVTVPQPIVYGETVLVEELVEDATGMTTYMTQASESLRKELAGPLLRAFLKMIFLDNFVHCDLHSGNILVQEVSRDYDDFSLDHAVAWMVDQWNYRVKGYDTQTEHRRRIVFLDAGIVVRLEPNDLRNLRDLFKAVILNDGATAGTLMVKRSQNPSQCRNVEGFSKKVEALVTEFHDNRKAGLTLGAVRIGSLLSRVLDVCHQHSVEIDPNMASIVVSTLVLEGLGRSLDPDLNLIDFAIPFVLGRGRV